MTIKTSTQVIAVGTMVLALVAVISFGISQCSPTRSGMTQPTEIVSSDSALTTLDEAGAQ